MCLQQIPPDPQGTLLLRLTQLRALRRAMDEQDESPAPAASAPTHVSSFINNKSILSPPGSEPASPSSSSSSSSAESEFVSESEAAPSTREDNSLPKSRANDSEDESEDDASEQESDDESTEEEAQLDIPSLRSRLTSFIPRIAAANRRLARLEALEGAERSRSGASGEATKGDKKRKRKRDGFEIVSLDDTDDAAARASGSSKRARAEKEESAEEQDEGEDDDASSEEGPYIEMDLGLGVLEEKPTQAGREPGDILFRAPEGAEGSESESTSDGGDSNAGSESGNVMEKLMAIGSSKGKQRKKPSAQGQISEAPND